MCSSCTKCEKSSYHGYKPTPGGHSGGFFGTDVQHATLGHKDITLPEKWGQNDLPTLENAVGKIWLTDRNCCQKYIFNVEKHFKIDTFIFSFLQFSRRLWLVWKIGAPGWSGKARTQSDPNGSGSLKKGGQYRGHPYYAFLYGIAPTRVLIRYRYKWTVLMD